MSLSLHLFLLRYRFHRRLLGSGSRFQPGLHASRVGLTPLEKKDTDQAQDNERVPRGQDPKGFHPVALRVLLRGVDDRAEAVDGHRGVDDNPKHVEGKAGAVKKDGAVIPLVQLANEPQHAQANHGVQETLDCQRRIVKGRVKLEPIRNRLLSQRLEQQLLVDIETNK